MQAGGLVLSERATSIGMPGPAEAEINRISGSNRPEAAGHRFGPDLTCIECGRTWDEHQADPSACTPAPEHPPQFTARVDGGR